MKKIVSFIFLFCVVGLTFNAYADEENPTRQERKALRKMYRAQFKAEGIPDFKEGVPIEKIVYKKQRKSTIYYFKQNGKYLFFVELTKALQESPSCKENCVLAGKKLKSAQIFQIIGAVLISPPLLIVAVVQWNKYYIYIDKAVDEYNNSLK